MFQPSLRDDHFDLSEIPALKGRAKFKPIACSRSRSDFFFMPSSQERKAQMMKQLRFSRSINWFFKEL
jgi:hypothetical protein